MDPKDLKQAITVISEIHTRYRNVVADSKGADFLEKKAFNFIIDYCSERKYKVDGFPTDSTLYDELTYNHWMLYVDKLTLAHDDVAQLHWHWVISFWPKEYESFDVFLGMIKARIKGGL